MMITKFINEINVSEELKLGDGKIHREYRFYGDGVGDFEQVQDSASKQCVREYIKICKSQIRLAEKYLEEVSDD